MRKNVLYLLLADLIWGAAFVAQRTGGDAVGAYTFTFVRSILGAAVLLPVIFFRDRIGAGTRPQTAAERTRLWVAGIACGTALSFASNLQQVGITLGAAVGKAGFLTACYIIMVPIIGIFLGKSCSKTIWLGVFLSLAGLYMLCMETTFSLARCDILLLLCALAFAIQILCIDHFAPSVDTVRLSCLEFLVCGVLTFIPVFFVDMGHRAEGIAQWAEAFLSWDAWIAILYAGVGSCGIAYTLQIAGQRNFNPTVASLIMSLESVFSVLAGWIFLKEKLSARELLGCMMIFLAIILAQGADLICKE